MRPEGLIRPLHRRELSLNRETKKTKMNSVLRTVLGIRRHGDRDGKSGVIGSSRGWVCLHGVCLDLQEVTVKVHLRNVYRKIKAANRTDAVRIAITQGWRG